ncbi:TPA: DUF2591 family protein [Morganella morganii]|nr:DUF2591 family protein [Morganella morganii]
MMNKYRDKSDFEINKAVAAAIGAKPFPPERTEFKQCEIPGLENAIIVKITGVKTGPFDPCNNPADAMPIVFEKNISLHAPRFSEGWMAEYTGSDDDVNDGFQAEYFDSHNQNPLRAAMEVFLMMKNG